MPTTIYFPKPTVNGGQSAEWVSLDGVPIDVLPKLIAADYQGTGYDLGVAADGRISLSGDGNVAGLSDGETTVIGTVSAVMRKSGRDSAAKPIDIKLIGHAPASGVTLSAAQMTENAVETTVGVLSAATGYGPLTYTLSDDAGGAFNLTDNGDGTHDLRGDGAAVDYEALAPGDKNLDLTLDVTDGFGRATQFPFAVSILNDPDADFSGVTIGALPAPTIGQTASAYAASLPELVGGSLPAGHAWDGASTVEDVRVGGAIVADAYVFADGDSVQVDLSRLTEDLSLFTGSSGSVTVQPAVAADFTVSSYAELITALDASTGGETILVTGGLDDAAWNQGTSRTTGYDFSVDRVTITGGPGKAYITKIDQQNSRGIDWRDLTIGESCNYRGSIIDIDVEGLVSIKTNLDPTVTYATAGSFPNEGLYFITAVNSGGLNVERMRVVGCRAHGFAYFVRSDLHGPCEITDNEITGICDDAIHLSITGAGLTAAKLIARNSATQWVEATNPDGTGKHCDGIQLRTVSENDNQAMTNLVIEDNILAVTADGSGQSIQPIFSGQDTGAAGVIWDGTISRGNILLPGLGSHSQTYVQSRNTRTYNNTQLGGNNAPMKFPGALGGDLLRGNITELLPTGIDASAADDDLVRNRDGFTDAATFTGAVPANAIFADLAAIKAALVPLVGGAADLDASGTRTPGDAGALQPYDDTWAPVSPVTVVVPYGQSEPNGALFKTGGTHNKASLREPVEAGADAKVIYRNTEGNVAALEIVDVTQANADAGKLNPGLIAWVNAWTRAGRGPLRIVHLCQDGTGMDNMLNLANAHPGNARDTQADVDVAAAAIAAWGSDNWHAIRIWDNSEATANRTLPTSRCTHILGINSDGTPYDWTANTLNLDYCLIDTAGQGKGILPDGTVHHTAAPFAKALHTTSTDALWLNTYVRPDGSEETNGMVRQNGIYQNASVGGGIKVREDFIAFTPAANRGRLVNAPAPVMVGDYDGGVALAGGESAIHVGTLTEQGNVWYGYHLAAMCETAIWDNDLRAFVDRVEWASDGSYADVIFSLAAGKSLTTDDLRNSIGDREPTIPHFQPVMGFSIGRSGGGYLDFRPVHRSGQAGVPADSCGTVVLQNAGYDNGGEREAIVRITPDVPFVNGDQISFATDGTYPLLTLGHFDHDDAEAWRRVLVIDAPELRTI